MQQRFLLQILLLAQHVSGTTMPIIRSSRVLYCGCCLWYFMLWFSSWCCSILQTGHLTLSSTPDQQLENHSTKYHRQQPLYNTLELLMMGVVVPETCWASNQICNKNLCCIYLAFYFPILMTMHGQNHINLVILVYDIFTIWYVCRMCNSGMYIFEITFLHIMTSFIIFI